MDNKIKSVRISKYDFSGEGKFPTQIKGEGIRHAITEYHQMGQVILEAKYDDDGRFESKETKKYNKEGQLIEEKNYISERQVADHKTYEFDEKEKVVKAFKHYQDDSKDTIKYEYDDDGNLIVKTTIDSYDEEESREVAQYKNGRVIKTELFEYDEIMKWESFELDKAGKILKHKMWQQDEQEVTIKNTYDENDNLIKTLVYNDKEELTGKTTYGYDDNKLLISIEEQSAYGITKTQIARDENGNATEQIEYNANQEINNSVIRIFNENNDLTEARVFINMHNRDVNQRYVLKYEYDYFD